MKIVFFGCESARFIASTGVKYDLRQANVAGGINFSSRSCSDSTPQIRLTFLKEQSLNFLGELQRARSKNACFSRGCDYAPNAKLGRENQFVDHFELYTRSRKRLTAKFINSTHHHVKTQLYEYMYDQYEILPFSVVVPSFKLLTSTTDSEMVYIERFYTLCWL